MEFDRKKLLRSSASKLRKLRELFGYSPKEMADYFRVHRTAYHKNESGYNLPGLPSLHRLSKDHDISMDWYFFDKGPMYFKEKGNAEELLEKREESQKKVEELEKKNETLEKELEKEREKNLGLAVQVKPGVEVKPEVEELLEHMAAVPLLYHEVLTHFQRFKIENRELVETSMGSSLPPQEK
jgi:transcriptional regulator with XRE-family HTH domain